MTFDLMTVSVTKDNTSVSITIKDVECCFVERGLCRVSLS